MMDYLLDLFTSDENYKPGRQSVGFETFPTL